MQITNQTDRTVGYRILGVPTSPGEDLAVAAQRLVQAFEHYVKTQLVVLDRVARGETEVAPPTLPILGESELRKAVAAHHTPEGYRAFVEAASAALQEEPPPAVLEGARSVATEPGVPVGVRLGHTIVGPLAPAVRNGLDDAERGD